MKTPLSLRALGLGALLLSGVTGCSHHRIEPVPAGFNYPSQGITIEAPLQLIQSGGVSGQILDLARKPVQHALVEIFDPIMRTRIAAQFSTKSGKFTFRRLPHGRFSLRITKPSFSRSVTPLDVHDGKMVTQLVIELHPAI